MSLKRFDREMTSIYEEKKKLMRGWERKFSVAHSLDYEHSPDMCSNGSPNDPSTNQLNR